MIVWLASYPKSGNTWIRAFLCNYLYSSNGKFNFSLLDKINEFPEHNILKKFMDRKNFHNLKEVSKNWIRVQEIMNLDNKLNFLKTHSSFCNINGNSFSNGENTSVFIYIVRDPRNVILSMSNHFGISQEESFKIITNEKYIVYPMDRDQTLPSSLVSSWKNHYLSWKNFHAVSNIFIKYEDLIQNTKESFIKIVNFLKDHVDIENNEEKIINSIDSTNFQNLKKYEEKHGFNMGQTNKFFHLAEKNDWRKLLDPKIAENTKSEFKIAMNELGYI